MIEEQATVTRCEGKYVWVETQRQSSCGHCSVKNTCGTSVLAKVLGNKLATVRCLNVQHKERDADMTQLKTGDRVIIGLQESALVSGSLLIYFLPLVTMILFGGLAVFAAKIWLPEWLDLASIVASFSGLLIGLYASKKIAHDRQNGSLQQKMSYQYEPVILKKIASIKPLRQIDNQCNLSA